MDDGNMTVHIDGLVLDAGESLATGLREHLGGVLTAADVEPVSRAVAAEVRRSADRAAPGVPA